MNDFLPITMYGTPILRKKMKQVEKIDDSIIALADKMFRTMINAHGVGLAAPQVNVNQAIAVVDVSYLDEYKNTKPVLLINPVVKESFGEDVGEEGCLSIPDIRVQVRRPEQVLVTYRDLDMKEQTIEADAFFARVLQHEIDHLNGKLMLDYLNEDELKKLKPQLLQIKKGEIIPDYPHHTHDSSIL